MSLPGSRCGMWVCLYVTFEKSGFERNLPYIHMEFEYVLFELRVLSL